MKDSEKIILQKIKKYALQAIEFKGAVLSIEDFEKDAKTVAACSMMLAQVGELAGKLNENFIDSHNHIHWRQMRALRNRIAHDYEGLNLEIMWEVLDDLLPKLIDDIRELLRFE